MNKLSTYLRTRLQNFIDANSLIDSSLQAKIKELRKQMAKDTKSYKVSGEMSPLIGAEYTIFEADLPCTFWGFVDISDLRAGDTFKIEVLFKSVDSKYKPYISKDYIAPLVTPILDFDPKSVLGVKVVIKQPSGFPERKLLYNFDWVSN